MRYLIAFFALIVSFPILAQQEHLHHRVNIHLDGRDIQELASLGLEVDHGDYAPFKHLINDFSEQELARISAAGFTYEILIPDVAQYYADPSRAEVWEGQPRGESPCSDENDSDVFPYSVPSNFHLGSMAGFFTYQEMLVILDSMRLLYPNLINTRQSIGNIATHEGRPIFWLRISDNPDTNEATEPEILYTALHHAREPNSLSQMIFYMWYLLENYDTDPEVQYLINNTEMYFIPCINPDGYLFNETIGPDGGGLWRKNRRLNEGGSMGVDLNRNYGYNWGFDDDGSSPNPTSQVYRGTAGFSEPETQAVKYLCDQHDFVLTLNYHTYGNLLIYPWGYSDMPTEDSLTFNTLAQVMTLQNAYFSGTGTETVGYTVNGDADDWMYGETTSKPSILAMTPEVGTNGFWPSIDAIIPNCKASLWMNLAAANTPHISGVATGVPDQYEINGENPFLNFQVQRFGLADGPLTVSLSTLQPDLISVSEDAKVFNLNPNELRIDSFSLSVLNDIPAGSELNFVLTIDNGAFTRTDTVRSVYGGFISTPVFNDDMGLLSNWTAEEWNITDEDFISMPTSLTDSPYTTYANNALNTIELNMPITVGDAEQYKLKFWTRWDIEPFYDFAQLSFRINGGEWQPACGRYTVSGSAIQDLDQPVWEGTQEEWVEEEIDLTPYLSEGDEIDLQFVLVSDEFITMDGFYIDDIRLEELNMEPVSTTYLPNEDFKLSIFPNPTYTESVLQFRVNSSLQGDGQWQIHHNNGTVLLDGKLTVRNGYGQEKLNTSTLAAGIYWLSAWGEHWRLPVRKLVVIK